MTRSVCKILHGDDSLIDTLVTLFYGSHSEIVLYTRP
jgi:hypothetical protein